MRKFNIDFMGNRNIMFGISIVLLVVAIASLGIRHLQFGVEFKGGTVVTIADSGSVTQTQMTDAFKAAGLPNVVVQGSQAGVNAKPGFIIRSSETSAAAASTAADKAIKAVGLSASEKTVTTIGPNWGANVTSSALLALGVSILAILLYVSLRFEYKMSVTAVIALVHDIVITLGLYALIGWEVTPNVVAALLAILGYSLYDTIVVFHRIKENSQGLVKTSYMSMANTSINEVLVRSINTTLTSLIPVVVLLLFGGSTLKDYALALTIGLTSGAYSSIGVAAPLFAMWKEREPKFAALAKKYANAS
ncbi:MAG: protein translocase subunit SecF [Coriobacteriia bacterium]|nr:protein translocase subunit SecF [Coriobacteriia bacterium]